MRCNSFSPFNRTKDRSRRWSWSLKNKRFNVNIPLMQTAWAVQLFGRFRCTKIWFTSDAIQSSLLAALGSVLRRLRSISELSVCTCVCFCLCQQAWDATTCSFSASCWGMQSPKCNAVDVSCIVFCVLCFVCACLCQHACRATAFAFQRNQRQIPTWIYVDTSLRTTSLKLTARLCRPREPYNYWHSWGVSQSTFKNPHIICAKNHIHDWYPSE